MRNWIGVEIDGSLAKSTGDETIGRPIKNMVERIQDILNMGFTDVKIFTRRTSPIMEELHGPDYITDQIKRIHKFCQDNLGVQLPITSCIDPYCTSIWDARVTQIITNQGVPLIEALDKLAEGDS